ncbi:MAG: transcription elongation factor GreA [Armatimonadetes bacterium]|nr:transcription elongation factor GreA [Armatimonadota bacterium]
MSDEMILSPEGLEKLKKELEFLKGDERQRIAENIREAKSHGDLRENAMYHEAKLNQTRLESRIAEIEAVLNHAKVIEKPEGFTGIHLGSMVKLLDKEFGDELSIELVGAFEADPTMDKISVSSPMGAALMGKEAGDEIEFETPGGTNRFKVLEIS